MKKILCVLVFFALLCTACKENEQPYRYMSEGIITGPDTRRCVFPCCGGYFIEIEGATYRITSGVSLNDLDLANVNFPLPVYLDWGIANDNFGCITDRIFVCAIEAQ